MPNSNFVNNHDEAAVYHRKTADDPHRLAGIERIEKMHALAGGHQHNFIRLAKPQPSRQETTLP